MAPLPGFRCHVTTPQASGLGLWRPQLCANRVQVRALVVPGWLLLPRGLHHLSAPPPPPALLQAPHAWGSIPGPRSAWAGLGALRLLTAQGARHWGCAAAPAVPGARIWPRPRALAGGGGKAARRAQAASTNRARRLVRAPGPGASAGAGTQCPGRAGASENSLTQQPGSGCARSPDKPLSQPAVGDDRSRGRGELAAGSGSASRPACRSLARDLHVAGWRIPPASRPSITEAHQPQPERSRRCLPGRGTLLPHQQVWPGPQPLDAGPVSSKPRLSGRPLVDVILADGAEFLSRMVGS